MPRPISIGTESFRDIRTQGAELVDKTRLVEQLCADPSKVLLFPRPRRFGKTVALSMLSAFFSIPMPERSGKLPDPPARALFEGLYLETVWDTVAPHFQRYPTLMLNFKGLQFSTSAEWWEQVQLMLAGVIERMRPLLGLLSPAEEALVAAVGSGTCSKPKLGRLLQYLTEWLHRSTGERALVLIDEYDAPIQEAWTSATELTDQAIARLESDEARTEARRVQRERQALYREVVGFFRTFLGHGLKTNDSLHKGILTGILRISKESLFSDLNNIAVYTMMETQFSDAFGFTEAEVQALFRRQEQEENLESAKSWYNGYRFGNAIIFNPWSILCYLKQKPVSPQPYWLNTSENTLVKHLFRRATRQVAEDFERLLREEPVVQPIRGALSLQDLAYDREGLFNLLYWSGYLKAELHEIFESEEATYRLSIPNVELRLIFRESFRKLLTVGESAGGLAVQGLTSALLSGNAKVLQVLLSNLAVHLISYLDGDPRDPEAFYQGLMLGLLAWLEGEYSVRSNRETGLGRADLLILPKVPGKPGALLELKSTREGRSLDGLLRQGAAQVKKRQYEAELLASGATPFYRWVVAFDGKQLKLKLLR